MLERLDFEAMARRAAKEIASGQVVALGPGIAEGVTGQVPSGSDVWFLTPAGTLAYGGSGNRRETVSWVSVPLSTVDTAAVVHGGHVDTAIIEAAWVNTQGDFAHWTSGATPGLNAPGSAVELAACSGRVIAVMRHTRADGTPNILETSPSPADGHACISVVVTDVSVMTIEHGQITVLETAPGWTFDEVVAITGATISPAANLVEMTMDTSIAQAQPRQKVYATGLEAVRDIPNGAMVNIDGFAGPGGMPHYLMVSLRDHGAKDLTIISNTAGITRVVNFGTPPGRQAIDHSILVENRQVKKAISSYPVSPSPSTPTAFELAFQRGDVELEVVPQGTLAERIRAGGAGVPAFYTPTGVGTLLADGKETRTIDGKEYVLEESLKADYCLIRALKADTLGNVVYKGTSRNFNPIMATSAEVTIVEVDEIVEPGELGPEDIVTPGIFIDRIVLRPADFSPYD